MANLSPNVSLITFDVNIPIKTEIGRVNWKTCPCLSIYDGIFCADHYTTYVS